MYREDLINNTMKVKEEKQKRGKEKCQTGKI
jgi:hypothetical protein